MNSKYFERHTSFLRSMQKLLPSSLDLEDPHQAIGKYLLLPPYKLSSLAAKQVSFESIEWRFLHPYLARRSFTAGYLLYVGRKKGNAIDLSFFVFVKGASPRVFFRNTLVLQIQSFKGLYFIMLLLFVRSNNHILLEHLQ